MMDTGEDFGVIVLGVKNLHVDGKEEKKEKQEVKESKKPVEEWMTLGMDTTSSYNSDWFNRTKAIIDPLSKLYPKRRAVFINDNCNKSLDCTCKTCQKSLIIHPWTEDIKVVKAQFEHAKDDVFSGSDVPEKHPCALHSLADEYEKKQLMPHGVKQTVILFMDAVGHGCSNQYDAYSETGCPTPKTCGCMGDALQESLRLAKYGVRICIFAPNRSLEDRHFAVYVTMIAYATNGWVMALPDDQDKSQKFVLDILESVYKLSERFKEMNLTQQQLEVKKSTLDTLLATLGQVMTALDSGAAVPEVDRAVDMVEKGLNKEGITESFVPPGTVHARNFGGKEFDKLIVASKFGHTMGSPKYLRDAMTEISKTIEIFIITDPDEKGKPKEESIVHRCNTRYRSVPSRVAAKTEVLFAIPDREIADPMVRCHRRMERVRGRVEVGAAQMVKVYVHLHNTGY